MKRRVNFLKKWLLGLIAVALLVGSMSVVVLASGGGVDKYTMRDIDAHEFVSEMKIGFNLGNTFDAFYEGLAAGVQQEWAWLPGPDAKTTKATIDVIAARGFDVIRIPVTWTTQDENGQRVGDAASGYAVRPDFLARVEEVVNWALDDGMYVIINGAHHDDWMTAMTETGWNNNSAMVESVWRQISEHFKAYGDRLIFETMNEPRSGNNWTGTAATYDVVNRYNQMMLNVLRATGGNNDKRFLLLPDYGAQSTANPLNGFVKPNDPTTSDKNKLIGSVHAYEPQGFATSGSGNTTWGTDTQKNTMDTMMARIFNAFDKLGMPTIIGEFGATNKNNDDQRAIWADYYVTAAKQYGMPCLWWDISVWWESPGVIWSGADCFGILDRETRLFHHDLLVDAMLIAAKGDEIDLPTITITGPASVVSGAGATAGYMISGANMPEVGGIELVFEVDGDFLSSKEFTAMGGFSFIGNGNYGTPIHWNNNGNIWTGKVTLVDMSAAVGAGSGSPMSGDFDIMSLVFNVVEGATGDAAVKLISVMASYLGEDIEVDIVDGLAVTSFLKYYSPYDLNKDEVIDIHDITYALQYLLVEDGDPQWEVAKHIDYNNDGKIDINDLIVILANYTVPYYS